MSQEDVLGTLIGNAEYYTVCGAIFGCGTPLADETGSASLTGGGDIEAARGLLEDSYFDGTAVVLLQTPVVVMQMVTTVVGIMADSPMSIEGVITVKIESA